MRPKRERGKSAGETSTIVYRYGLLRPTSGADDVRRMMRAAHVFRNQLVEIERGRRAASREAIGGIEIEALEATRQACVDRVEGIEKSVKSDRAKARSRKKSPEAIAGLKEARAAARDAAKALAAKRKELGESAKERREQIGALANELKNNAYLHSELKRFEGWGTRALLTDAMDASRKMPLYLDGLPNDPRFLRWHGEGQLGVQVHQQGSGGRGLSWAETFTANSNDAEQPVRLVWSPGPKDIEAHRRRHTLRVRIGANDGAAIWAEWPCVVHRAWPSGAVLRRVAITCSKVGEREEWYVTMTLQIPKATPECGVGAVAVHLGWRARPNGLRVATWMDDTGEVGEVLLPIKESETGRSRWGVMARLDKVSDLRSIRDKNFDAIKEALLATDFAPPNLSAWKSQARLAWYVRSWATNRLHGDEAIFEKLDAWRIQDRHLYQWERDQEQQTERHRRELYRIFAAKLAQRYSVVICDDTDLRQIMRGPRTEEDGEARAVRLNARRAATGELREIVAHAFRRRGGTVRASTVSNATCPACGTNEKAHVSGHAFACSRCEFAHDVDHVALLGHLRGAGYDDEVGRIIDRARSASRAMRESQGDAQTSVGARKWEMRA